MKVLADLDVSGKRVFVRADLDIPLANSNDQTPNSKLGLAEQATRLKNLKPTVDWLIEHGARQIIIAGHINRPQKPDPALSTKQLLEPLERILGRKIAFCEDLGGPVGRFLPAPSVNSGQAALRVYPERNRRAVGNPSTTATPQILLLENLRFWDGELKNDREFAKQLAVMADVYVNEAFGNCHRAHASMVALPLLFPDVEDLIESEDSSESERPEGRGPRTSISLSTTLSVNRMGRRAAGLHLEKEVEVLSKLLKNPARPFVAIVGGVKIETKVPVVENLAKVADWVLVGGEIAKKYQVSSIKYQDKVTVAKLTENEKDIDNVSVNRFVDIIKGAKTIVWNGPMGVFEEGFDKGTKSIAQAIIESGVYSVVGGGETTQFLGKLGILAKFGFISSGGGAMLEFLAGNELPGLAALA